MDWNNRDVVLVAVKQSGFSLIYASTKLQEDLRNEIN